MIYSRLAMSGIFQSQKQVSCGPPDVHGCPVLTPLCPPLVTGHTELPRQVSQGWMLRKRVTYPLRARAFYLGSYTVLL